MKKVVIVGLFGSIIFMLAKLYKKLSWHKKYIDEAWNEVADIWEATLRQEKEIERIDQKNDKIDQKFYELDEKFEEAVTNGRACCSTVWLGQLEDRFEQLEEEFETFKRFRT